MNGHEWYKNYLKSDQWKLCRKAALIRAGYRCQVCGARHGLHVHHNDYARVGREEPEDLVVLCEVCHSWFHLNRISSGHDVRGINEVLVSAAYELISNVKRNLKQNSDMWASMQEAEVDE